jgi:hypothetical protein
LAGTAQRRLALLERRGVDPVRGPEALGRIEPQAPHHPLGERAGLEQRVLGLVELQVAPGLLRIDPFDVGHVAKVAADLDLRRRGIDRAHQQRGDERQQHRAADHAHDPPLAAAQDVQVFDQHRLQHPAFAGQVGAAGRGAGGGGNGGADGLHGVHGAFP